MNQGPNFPINSNAGSMNQNPNFPFNSNVGNMNWNLNQEENHQVDDLDLSLHVGIRTPPPPQQRLVTVEQPQQLPLGAQPKNEQKQALLVVEVPPQAPLRARRRLRTEPLRPEETIIIPPPYPWATNRRASIYSLQELTTRQISSIPNQVQCKRCDRQFEMEYNLQEKSEELNAYITANRGNMHDRAGKKWMEPVLPSCRFCGQDNCVKPIISAKKRSINWLFLLLGQLLGCLNLDQLKYFGKHRKFHHRSGAKNRVLYMIYMDLVAQLIGNPN